MKSISYEKFIKMTNELGTDPSEEDSILAILTTFYSNDKRSWNDCIDEFNSLLSQNYNGSLKLNLDFEDKKAEYFIIADLYLSKSDFVSLYNHLSNKKVKDISIDLAQKVKNDFLQSVSHFKEKYEWIFNPPILPGMNKHTIGRQLRQEFQEDYGAYAEITYLLSKGDAMKFEEVNKMKLANYLAMGEYLIRKRAVEGVD